ncbi:uncharacterized protein LOC110182530 [Drosophila serrata]|uniref:uncharacterized protein LOC110182530 n=1 Tax=Drosophila serrata TaxID=7274 RepID=UPI000A1D07B9|nr:uncharacterized protein LOC110182530 [Drosophila serrata]
MENNKLSQTGEIMSEEIEKKQETPLKPDEMPSGAAKKKESRKMSFAHHRGQSPIKTKRAKKDESIETGKAGKAGKSTPPTEDKGVKPKVYLEEESSKLNLKKLDVAVVEEIFEEPNGDNQEVASPNNSTEAGEISANNEAGVISANNEAGEISSNAEAGEISSNAEAEEISSNAEAGEILEENTKDTELTLAEAKAEPEGEEDNTKEAKDDDNSV